MTKCGQISMEFMLTSGLAFFIIVAGVSIIYSTDIISFSNTLPEKCEFLAQVTCNEAQLLSTGVGSATVNVSLTNNFGVDLYIYNATLIDSHGTTCTGLYVPHGTGIYQGVFWPSDSRVVLNITGCTGITLNKDQRFEGDISVSFYKSSASCDDHPPNCLYTSVGQLLAKIN